MTVTYKCQLREPPLEVSLQPSRGDPYECFTRILAVLPIHLLSHFQQGKTQPRSLSRVYLDYWHQLRPRHLLPDMLGHGEGGD